MSFGRGQLSGCGVKTVQGDSGKSGGGGVGALWEAEGRQIDA